MDSMVVQDLLPGTGSLGSVPAHHNYKRQVIRPPPKRFSVEVVPPRKFGNGFCYGLRILPHEAHEGVQSSACSTNSGSSNTEYEVWRRWEDCLWFQDLLETEYKLMARTKRSRLAQGKGVKKNGIYMQSDGAASFDSLPPGPDANSIAKDVHDILPKLTKKGTLFRASQATIEQRQKEFSSLIFALFEEDVPSLIIELRESRIVRDFFAYWRRDKDHDRKANEVAGQARASRVSVTSSAFSMYFASSNISLQLPNAFADMPPSPSIQSALKARAKGKGKERVVSKSASFSSSSSSSSSSSRGGPQTPTSAPAGLSFTVSESGALIPTSPTSDAEDYFGLSGPSSAPPIAVSSRRSRGSKAEKNFPTRQDSSESDDGPILFVPDSPWAGSFGLDIHRSRNLEALIEEQELVPGVAALALDTPVDPHAPARRPRNLSCPDPHNRNGLVFVTPPQGPVPVQETHDDVSLIDSIRGDSANHSDSLPETPKTASSSSRHTSMALSNFSGEFSRRSSWTTSMDSLSSLPADGVRDSCFDIDDMLCSSPSFHSPLINGKPDALPTSVKRASVTTMNSVMSNSSVDAVLPRGMISPILPGANLRRSLSAGSRAAQKGYLPSPSVPSDEVWFDAGDIMEDELLDAYFYDPSLCPPSVTPSVASPDTPRNPREPRDSSIHLPPLLSRAGGPLPATSTPSSPRPSHISLSSIAPSTPSVVGDSFTIKAVRQDSIVLIRASYTMSLTDVRNRMREKFAVQEGITLTDSFTIGFNPAVTAADDRRSKVVRGRPRSQSTSALRSFGAQAEPQPRLRFLIYEEDWQQAAANCPGKMTLHVFDRF